MTELTVAYDGDTGQVTMEGLPTGAAGEAAIIPAHGLELTFDRADGRLARVLIDTAEPGEPAGTCGPGGVAGVGPAARLLTRLFGPDASAEVRQAARTPGLRRVLSPEPGLTAILSRLARLDAARHTSPVRSGSALWAAEGAALAAQAGLDDRARAQARQAADGLVHLPGRMPVPDGLGQAALALACPGPRRRAAGEHAPGVKWSAEWSLDPSLVPEGVFVFGLSPCSDLLVQSGPERTSVVVEATLAQDADHDALSRCRARLVDPATRRVLVQGSFSRADSRARAELQLPSSGGGSSAAWVEVVDDEHRPVRSERSRRLRRALRWADVAVRAGQRPAGLAPGFSRGDWTMLAAIAWRHCQYNWERAGDTSRAYVAAARLATLDPRSRPPEPPSSWAAQLAARPSLEEPAFLAEMAGE